MECCITLLSYFRAWWRVAQKTNVYDYMDIHFFVKELMGIFYCGLRFKVQGST